MNTKIIMFTIVIVLSSLVAILQLWLLLLNDRGAQPLWLLIGAMGIVGGFLNIRRIRIEQRENEDVNG